MPLQQLDLALLLGAGILLLAVASVRLSVRLGVPSLLIYLAIGLGLGEAGLGLHFDSARLTQVLGVSALVIILAEGGLTTRWPVVRSALGRAVVLSTLGVGVSVALTGCVARLLLHTDWRLSLLLGAVVSSTDAAAVFSTLRRLPLRPRLAAVLEAESGLNDAPTVILVTILATGGGGPGRPWPIGGLLVGGLLVYELLAGALIGLLIGRLGVAVLRRSALPAAGLYPLAAVALAVLAYAVAAVAHSSGFLAVYVAGVLLGNAELPHHRATLGFAEGLAWLAQIGLFVMLGLLASPHRLAGAILPALAVGGGLLLLARPLSVLASMTWFRMRWREQAFLSVAGLRGAVPIVLATIPVTAGLSGGLRLFDVVFVLVVVFTVIQGGTLAPLAGRLGVLQDDRTAELSVESAPLEDLHADLLQLRVPPASRLVGVYLPELRLPAGAAVTLVVRDGAAFVPQDSTRLRAGDDVLVVTTTTSREAAERRLHAVSRRGRLAGWLPDTGRNR